MTNKRSRLHVESALTHTTMKRILFSIALLLPAFGWAQEKGDYYAQFSRGAVEDVLYTDLDINPWSPDMSTHRGISNLRYGNEYSLGYYISSNISIGVNYRDAEIFGENWVESYEGQFTEKNMFAKINVLDFGFAKAFAGASYGWVDFSASRSLMLDNGVVPLNSYTGSASKRNLSAGLSLELNEQLSLIIEYSQDEVEHDGFDGWDYATSVDRYIFKSIGIRYHW